MYNKFQVCNILLFSSSVVSDSFTPQGLQHAKLSCPSATPRVGQLHRSRSVLAQTLLWKP